MRLLICLTRFPYPLNKGDKLRAFNQIKYLSRKADIYLYCIDKKTVDISPLLPYCKKIHVESLNTFARFLNVFFALFSCLPLQTAYFTTRKSKQNFCKFYSEIKPHTAYFQFVRSAEYAKVIDGYKVLDYQDALSKNMERRASISRFPLNIIFSYEAKRLKKYEAEMPKIFDKLAIITEKDRDALDFQERKRVIIIENGVSEEFFSYPKKEKIFGVIFSGNMSYKPNIVAAKYLVNEIMPIVWKKFPNEKVIIVGSNPTAEVRSLARKYGGLSNKSNSKNQDNSEVTLYENKVTDNLVTVTGWVKDMREYYARSEVFIAPMQIGTGLQNKILEAMAMNLPCVTTSLAFNALQAERDVDILVADSAEKLADKIIKLLLDKTLSAKIASKGNFFVKEKYSWERSCEKLFVLLHSK